MMTCKVVKGWRLFSWAKRLMHGKSLEKVEDKGSKYILSMPVGRGKDENKVA